MVMSDIFVIVKGTDNIDDDKKYENDANDANDVRF